MNKKKVALTVLAGTAALHAAEWHLTAREIADAAKVPREEALVKCMLMGILWWKPLKESLVHKQPLDWERS